MKRLQRNALRLGSIAFLTVMAACSTPGPGEVSDTGIFDPAEENNRSVHAFNKTFDRVLFRPTARGFTTIVPDPVEVALLNFAANLSEPGDTVNYLLQGRFPEAGRSAGRFAINTIFGLGGFFDGATELGIAPTDTDFGETLHVWGVPEGAYVELPFFGPSTERDAVGVLADFFTNPLSLTLQLPLDNPGFYVSVVERTIDRGRFSDTVDSILYESADSYAQARLIYLQNRRFQLGGIDAEGFIDPYLDPYDDPYAFGDLTDPIEDENAQ